MEFPRVELFVNVIWRELNLAISNGGGTNPGKWPETLDSIFDGGAWRSLLPLPFNAIERADGWATRIFMLGKNGVTRYMLMHLTNHEDGRDLMKDSTWKACPEGGEFLVRISDDPHQKLIVTLDPDLSPLRQWVLDQLKKRPRRWQDLIDEIREEIWRKEHLNEVIRNLRNKEKLIDGRKYQGRCVPSSNPELYLL